MPQPTLFAFGLKKIVQVNGVRHEVMPTHVLGYSVAAEATAARRSESEYFRPPGLAIQSCIVQNCYLGDS